MILNAIFPFATNRSSVWIEFLIIVLLFLLLGLILGWLLFRKSGNECDTSAIETDLEALKRRLKSEEEVNKKQDAFLNERKVEDNKLWDAFQALKVSAASVSTPVIEPVAVKTELSTDDHKLAAVSAKKHLLNFGSFGTAEEHEKDDLKRISGVGPFIEKKLNALDIYTFKQVSKFTPDDIDNVTEAIEFFPGRITRDDWVSQAKKMM